MSLSNENVKRRSVEERPFSFVCLGESKTKQSFKKECDINVIMAKYQKTGALSHVNQFAGDYDFAPAISYLEAHALIEQADEMFVALPSTLRNKFDNDPSKFLAFVQDEGNSDEMRELGLLKVDEKPVPAEPVIDQDRSNIAEEKPAGEGEE